MKPAAKAPKKGEPRPGGPEGSSAFLAVIKDPANPNNPNDITLSKLSPFGKPPGVADEEWDTLKEKTAEFFDPDGGASSSRARRYLETASINAWPLIVNELLTLDMSNPEDSITGKNAQNTLNIMRGSTTGLGFNWRTPEFSGGALEPKDLWYNKFLVVTFHETWRKHLVDPDYFKEHMAKGKVLEAMEAAGGGGGGDEHGVQRGRHRRRPRRLGQSRSRRFLALYPRRPPAAGGH